VNKLWENKVTKAWVVWGNWVPFFFCHELQGAGGPGGGGGGRGGGTPKKSGTVFFPRVYDGPVDGKKGGGGQGSEWGHPGRVFSSKTRAPKQEGAFFSLNLESVRAKKKVGDSRGFFLGKGGGFGERGQILKKKMFFSV